MRRADIARTSAVTGGADYISTLPDQRRGVGVLWRLRIARLERNATSARRPQSLRGHLRKFVPELRQQIRLDELGPPTGGDYRNSYSVVGIVAGGRPPHPPPFAGGPQETFLGRLRRL